MRRHWDKTATFYAHEYRENVTDIIAEGRSGYSRIDYARILASWAVHDCFGGAFSWKRLGQVDPSVIQLGKRRNRGLPLPHSQVAQTQTIITVYAR